MRDDSLMGSPGPVLLRNGVTLQLDVRYWGNDTVQQFVKIHGEQRMAHLLQVRVDPGGWEGARRGGAEVAGVVSGGPGAGGEASRGMRSMGNITWSICCNDDDDDGMCAGKVS